MEKQTKQQTLNDAQKLVNKQREYFSAGATLPVKFRLAALKKLKANLVSMQAEICQALQLDLGKSSCEAYMSEIGMVICELNHTIKHLKSWAKPKKVHTALFQFAASSYNMPQPYGVVLVSSPWNYPVLLTLDPVVGAVAAGNCVVVKPSGQSANTLKVLQKLLSASFESGHVDVISGSNANDIVLTAKYDYIFFTGSANVGRQIMAKAAADLTPVSLELGGKSPCIVDSTAKIKLAAKRVAFGKYLNCGQTCVAPDYCLVDQKVAPQFVQQLKAQITNMYGLDPLNNPNYGRLINQRQFDRAVGLIGSGEVAHGGKFNVQTLQIEPTVLTNVDKTSAVMQQEIFAPILPVLTYTNLQEAIDYINSKDRPLALYLFTTSNKNKKAVLSGTTFGGGCINDTIMHIASTSLGFGGVGASGIGKYHGKNSFNTFSNIRGVLNKKNWIDLPLRYAPYSKGKEKIIKAFMK